jgi:hypothetical protein
MLGIRADTRWLVVDERRRRRSENSIQGMSKT